MFAFNDSAAAAAITIGGEAAVSETAAAVEADPAAVMAAAASVASEAVSSPNLTRTAQLEEGVQQLLDSWRYQVGRVGIKHVPNMYQNTSA